MGSCPGIEVEPLRELELLSPWFDSSSPTQAEAVPIEGPKRLLVIVAPPRAGSFHLCRLLWQLGYGRPTEYLNPNPLYRSSLERFGRVGSRAWTETLVKERSARSSFTGTPFFALKLQAQQGRGSLRQVLTKQFHSPLESLGLKREAALVVRLRRRDQVAAMASMHFSRCTGAFDFGLVMTHQGLPINNLLDQGAIAQTMAEYQVHLSWLEQGVREIPAVQTLDIETLVSDQAGTLLQLVKSLEPEANPIRDDPRFEMRLRRDDSPFVAEKRDWIERISAVVRELGGAVTR
jgi:LPS sulfotransferase NodH